MPGFCNREVFVTGMIGVGYVETIDHCMIIRNSRFIDVETADSVTLAIKETGREFISPLAVRVWFDRFALDQVAGILPVQMNGDCFRRVFIRCGCPLLVCIGVKPGLGAGNGDCVQRIGNGNFIVNIFDFGEITGKAFPDFKNHCFIIVH